MLSPTLMILAALSSPPPPAFTGATIAAAATPDASGFQYVYSVTNPSSNNLDVRDLEFVLGAAFPTVGGGGPAPCEFATYDGSLLVTWLNCGASAQPGQMISGLTLHSSRPPALLDGVVKGDVWVGYIDKLPADQELDEQETDALTAATTLHIPTIGPTPEQPGTFAYWDRWAADLGRAGQLGWIGDPALLSALQASVTAARQAVVARDRATALAKLQGVVDLVQQAPPGRCTPEGAALALLNAQYLKAYLARTMPSPVEPKLTLSPAEATHAVGETATVTASYRNLADGTPIAAWPLEFRVVSGPDSGLVSPVTTDAQGSAVLALTGKGVGIDLITAYDAFIYPSVRTTRATASLPAGAPQATVTWQGGPDLAVTAFTPPLLKSAPGNAFVVYETTTNLGNLPAGASVTRYYLAATWPVDPATAVVAGERSVPALAPGAASRVEALPLSVPPGVSPGTYYLAACADAGNAVIETDETNNCTTRNLVATLGVTGAELVNLPPDCSKAVAVPDLLWPPDHRLVAIAIAGVTDPDGDPVAVTITGISQDEPTNGLGDGDTAPDGFGMGTAQPQVRAERSGAGNGRVYAISFTASDGRGGTCHGGVKVGVPHDKGEGAPVDDGQKYDSTK